MEGAIFAGRWHTRSRKRSSLSRRRQWVNLMKFFIDLKRLARVANIVEPSLAKCPIRMLCWFRACFIDVPCDSRSWIELHVANCMKTNKKQWLIWNVSLFKHDVDLSIKLLTQRMSKMRMWSYIITDPLIFGGHLGFISATIVFCHQINDRLQSCSSLYMLPMWL